MYVYILHVHVHIILNFPPTPQLVQHSDKQARNPGTVDKRIANSGGRTDGTFRTERTDGKIATDSMQSFPPCYWQFYFMVFYVGR